MREIEMLKAVAYRSGQDWWGWQIPVYLFLGGLAAGWMILTSVRVLRDPDGARSDAARLGSWLAPVLVTAGMLALWLDLERRGAAMRFYLAFRPTAPMSWGAWILLAVYPLSILFAASELPEGWRARAGTRINAWIRWANGPRAKRRIAFGNTAVGAALGIYTGILLGVFSARPLWSSAVLGPLFLVSGLSTAAAAMLLLRLDPGERRTLSRIDAGLILLESGLLGLFLLGLASGGAAQRAAGRLVLGGAYTASFWGLVVIGGLAVPLAAEAWEMRGPHGSRWFVPVLILAGGLALRWILIAAGQAGAA